MNKPIRTMAVVCMVLFLALLLNATYLQYFRADAPQRPQRQPAGHGRGVLPEAGGDPGRRATRSRVSRPSDDRFEYQRRYPEPFKYAHLTGYYSYIYGATGGGVEPEPDPLRQRPAALRQPGRRHGQQHPARGRQRLAHGPPAGADRGVSTASGRSATTPRPRSSPSSRRPGKILAMASNPTYDPNLLASHDLESVQENYAPARATPGQPAAQPGDPGGLPAGVDVQAGHRGRRAVDRRLRRRTRWSRAASSSTCRRPTDTLPEQRRRQLRRRADHADPGARWSPATPPSARSGWSSAPTRCASRPRSSASDQRYLEGPVARRSASSRRPRRAADRAARRSASSTCAPPRCRWRWSPPTIANNGQGMRPYLVDEVRAPDLSVLDKTVPGRVAGPGDVVRRRQHADPDDGRGRRGGHRHDRADPGRQGRRQDRHRADRRGHARRTPGSSRSRPPTTPRSRSPS